MSIIFVYVTESGKGGKIEKIMTNKQTYWRKAKSSFQAVSRLDSFQNRELVRPLTDRI